MKKKLSLFLSLAACLALTTVSFADIVVENAVFLSLAR